MKGWEINNDLPYAEIEIDSWNSFIVNIEQNFVDHKEFLYRGHRDSKWMLEPTFDRKYRQIFNSLEKQNPKYVKTLSYEIVCERHLENFKRNSIGKRINPNKELSKIEWLALGQHYGLETPLLDWSSSPYIALYFAFENSQAPRSNLRTVWIFSPFELKDIAINSEPEVEYIQEVDSPIDENMRLLSQLGKFTHTPDNIPIETFIKENINLSGSAPVLYRMNIPNSFREEFLRHLNSMNINAASLYPDLKGAATRTNRELEKILKDRKWRDSEEFKGRLFNLDIYHT